MVDLFGNEIIEDALLRDRFLEPPFSVLDTRSGSWQKRKKQWKDKGIESEIVRKTELCMAQSINKYDFRESYTGTSVFDPALTELMYRWFCPVNGKILDPFAGGPVRGIVANYLDYYYTGIELSHDQVDYNRKNALDVLPVNNQPNWYGGDSDQILNDRFIHDFDMIFSCPPYLDLEIYSNNINDLSNMTDRDFIKKYNSIIKKSCSKLKKDGYAVFVVGDVRGKKTGFYKDFITITKNAFYNAGMGLYNEMILLENGLNTAAMRCAKTFKSGKKLTKVHQNVLVFKGLS